jgi:hypothetical protein
MANGPRDRRLEVGQSIQLTCRVLGNPWPHVRWFKDSDQIIPDGKLVFSIICYQLQLFCHVFYKLDEFIIAQL